MKWLALENKKDIEMKRKLITFDWAMLLFLQEQMKKKREKQPKQWLNMKNDLTILIENWLY
ncbi:MAG: hypothetical protein V3U87_15550 [Methylococcaceae bacterium]